MFLTVSVCRASLPVHAGRDKTNQAVYEFRFFFVEYFIQSTEQLCIVDESTKIPLFIAFLTSVCPFYVPRQKKPFSQGDLKTDKN